MLSRNVPGLAMPVPHLPAAASPTGLLSLHPDSLPKGIWKLPELGWLVDRARTCFTVIYFLGFCVYATRLALGLLLALRLYRRATPVQAAWAHARNIRVTPVMSLHEEKDLLHEKHIVLKTRDTEVRGSDGRFYEVVHGISLWNGVRVQDVYFDVTTQVNGRTSSIVIADAVASSLP